MTKEKYYILCKTDKNSITTKTISYLLFNSIWKIHGLLLSLTLDQGF